MSLFRILLCPCSFLCVTLCHNFLKFFCAFSVHLFHFWEDLEWILRISTKVLHRVDVSIAAEWSAVGSTVAFVAAVVSLASALTHDTMADDQAWTIGFLLSILDGFANLVNVVTIDLLYVPSPCFVFLGGILIGHHFCLGGELDIVGIIEHDEVVES